MKQKIVLLRTSLAGVLLLLGSGCAMLQTESNEPESETAELLYEGKPKVLLEAKEKAAKSTEEAMRRGEQALQIGDLDRALYHFISAYELDATLHAALYNIGMIHSRKGNVDRAALAFGLALKANPDHAESLMHGGLIKLRARQYAQAREYLEKAVAANPDLWQAHNGLGILADLGRDFGVARHHYETALLLNPSSPVLLNNFGYSKYLAGDWDGAQIQFEKALGLDAQYAKAWRNLGLIHVRRGHYVDALATLERAMDRATAYQRVGSLALMEGKHDIAEYFLNIAIDLSPAYYKDAYDELAKLEVLRSRENIPGIGLVGLPAAKNEAVSAIQEFEQPGSQEDLYQADQAVHITP